MVLDDEREHHWRMFYENNSGGVDRKKDLLHVKKWDVYNLEKKVLSKGGY